MQYIFKEESKFIKCRNYLDSNKLDYYNMKFSEYFLIKIFDKSLKARIEQEEPAFKKSENIDLKNGYLVTKQYKEKTIINIKGIKIGSEKSVVIAGPCSVEKEETLRKIASSVKKSGAHILRGGTFKPRTSPYDFEGLGKKGVELLKNIGEEFNMPIVTEVLDVRDLDFVVDKVDIIQVGSRNMYNYSLLKELGKINKPVLLKRGLSANLREFLLSAEYIMLGGNEDIILCERGIRTYNDVTRNTMDIAIIPLLKEFTHLPVIADPSHATGKKELISPMTKAALASGASGVLIETHSNPKSAWSDGEQSISIDDFENIAKDIVGR